jgi:predicted transcriptional regulator
MLVSMNEKRVQIGLKLPPALIERLDGIRKGMQFSPDRTALIEAAIEQWCDRAEAKLPAGKSKTSTRDASGPLPDRVKAHKNLNNVDVS